jgi:hypothetical protein
MATQARRVFCFNPFKAESSHPHAGGCGFQIQAVFFLKSLAVLLCVERRSNATYPALIGSCIVVAVHPSFRSVFSIFWFI